MAPAADHCGNGNNSVLVRTHSNLVRIDKIGLSNAHCDELANFTLGQTDKILGPAGSKNYGPLTFTGFNWTFAIKWVAVVDADQLAIMEQYWEDRQRQISHVRPEPSRISKKILERAKPIVLKELGEKLAVALGDDIGQLLLGIKLPDRLDQPAPNVQPVAALQQADPPSAAHKPASSPPEVVSRAHLRVVQTKNGRKFG